MRDWAAAAGLIVGVVLGCSSDGMSDAERCEQRIEEASMFLADHGTCTTDEDCVLASNGCYQGPEVACTFIPLNAQTDLEEWQATLDGLQAVCPNQCGGSACGSGVACNEGRCIATGP